LENIDGAVSVCQSVDVDTMTFNVFVPVEADWHALEQLDEEDGRAGKKNESQETFGCVLKTCGWEDAHVKEEDRGLSEHENQNVKRFVDPEDLEDLFNGSRVAIPCMSSETILDHLEIISNMCLDRG
jgi:hypothetical protein